MLRANGEEDGTLFKIESIWYIHEHIQSSLAVCAVLCYIHHSPSIPIHTMRWASMDCIWTPLVRRVQLIAQPIFLPNDKENLMRELCHRRCRRRHRHHYEPLMFGMEAVFTWNHTTCTHIYIMLRCFCVESSVFSFFSHRAPTNTVLPVNLNHIGDERSTFQSIIRDDGKESTVSKGSVRVWCVCMRLCLCFYVFVRATFQSIMCFRSSKRRMTFEFFFLNFIS